MGKPTALVPRFLLLGAILLTLFLELPARNTFAQVRGKGDNQLNTALLQAADKGDLIKVQALIAKGADVNAKMKTLPLEILTRQR